MSIVKKPKTIYPLPNRLEDLDYPYPEIIESRFFRVDIFKEGYNKDAGEDPTKDKKSGSPSNILSKLR